MRRAFAILASLVVVGAAGTAGAVPFVFDNILTIMVNAQPVVSTTTPGVGDVTTWPGGHMKTISFPGSFSAGGAFNLPTTGAGTNFIGFKATIHQGPQVFTATIGSNFSIFGLAKWTGRIATCGWNIACTSANTISSSPWNGTFLTLVPSLKTPSNLWAKSDFFRLTAPGQMIYGYQWKPEHIQHNPEPGTGLLMAGGLIILSTLTRRRTRK